MTALTKDPTSAAKAQPAAGADWRAAAIALLSIRIIQGFVYWGGGSRRFIYAPWKLDPDQSNWMANKFQTAMPGALFGLDRVIAYLLHHFWLLYAGIIIFSAIELFAGLALMAGLMTRFAALVSVGLSVVLMLLFGWQGGTCVDEWTMAACNLAMGATLMLTGSAAYSLDNALLRRNHALAGRSWFRWAGGSLKLPLNDEAFRKLGLAVLAFVLVFDIGIYNYYRGSVLTAYHGGPVSPTAHHFTISHTALLSDGSVRFHIYVDGGTPAVPAHVMKAEVLGADGTTLATWDTGTLSALPRSAIVNDFAYNTFKSGPYGLVADVGSAATVTLPPEGGSKNAAAGAAFSITDVNGKIFTENLSAEH